jgi:hypothetical protein
MGITDREETSENSLQHGLLKEPAEQLSCLWIILWTTTIKALVRLQRKRQASLERPQFLK